MITGRRSHFEARCRQRGVTLEQVQPCIVAEHADGTITVDESHPLYPRQPPPAPQPVRPSGPPPAGPGTELKKLLRLVGITATPTCPCNARAAQMDRWGADECESRQDEIVGWLREEAGRRRLPFVEMLAKKVVALAIRRARKAACR